MKLRKEVTTYLATLNKKTTRTKAHGSEALSRVQSQPAKQISTTHQVLKPESNMDIKLIHANILVSNTDEALFRAVYERRLLRVASFMAKGASPHVGFPVRRFYDADEAINLMRQFIKLRNFDQAIALKTHALNVGIIHQARHYISLMSLVVQQPFAAENITYLENNSRLIAMTFANFIASIKAFGDLVPLTSFIRYVELSNHFAPQREDLMRQLGIKLKERGSRSPEEACDALYRKVRARYKERVAEVGEHNLLHRDSKFKFYLLRDRHEWVADRIHGHTGECSIYFESIDDKHRGFACSHHDQLLWFHHSSLHNQHGCRCLLDMIIKQEGILSCLDVHMLIADAPFILSVVNIASTYQADKFMTPIREIDKPILLRFLHVAILYRANKVRPLVASRIGLRI